MKYILRTLWIIGYIPVVVFTSFCFFIALFTYPLVGSFHFIKTGKFEDITSIPDSFPTYIDKKYRELLKYL